MRVRPLLLVTLLGALAGGGCTAQQVRSVVLARRHVPAVHVRPSHAAVPILMYHVIAPPPHGAPYPSLYDRRGAFAAQLRALRRHGYEAVTLGRVWAAWHGRATLPPRPVVLSFDDGYRSDYTTALPLLRRLRWPGVLNLLVANLGRPAWGLTPGMVRRMIAAGWEVDSHTLTHPDLTTLSGARLRREVAGSRRALRRRLGVGARFFCYPAGRYDAAVERAVRRAVYLAASTEDEGLARPGGDPYALPRVRVDGGEPAATLLDQLAALRG